MKKNKYILLLTFIINGLVNASFFKSINKKLKSTNKRLEKINKELKKGGEKIKKANMYLEYAILKPEEISKFIKNPSSKEARDYILEKDKISLEIMNSSMYPIYKEINSHIKLSEVPGINIDFFLSDIIHPVEMKKFISAKLFKLIKENTEIDLEIIKHVLAQEKARNQEEYMKNQEKIMKSLKKIIEKKIKEFAEEYLKQIKQDYKVMELHFFDSLNKYNKIEQLKKEIENENQKSTNSPDSLDKIEALKKKLDSLILELQPKKENRKIFKPKL